MKSISSAFDVAFSLSIENAAIIELPTLSSSYSRSGVPSSAVKRVFTWCRYTLSPIRSKGFYPDLVDTSKKTDLGLGGDSCK
ncbi:MAG: hypothetical protein O3A57_08885, partial [Bacteroidetes bacterium]|nr:hypothetical protein [Bacteroidota bacterium]